MLVLTRKASQRILIGDSICITILRVRGQAVRIGIEAPEDVRVLRSELLEFDREATATTPEPVVAAPKMASLSDPIHVSHASPHPAPAPVRRPGPEASLAVSATAPTTRAAPLGRLLNRNLRASADSPVRPAGGESMSALRSIRPK